VLAFPVAFAQQDGRFMLVAVLGLEPKQNLYVSDDGRWLGRYVPAGLRAYPFGLYTADSAKHVVCVDENSGCLIPGPDGTPLFGEDGKPSAALLQVIDFLSKWNQHRVSTAASCGALQTHGLIEPWPIAVKSHAGENKVEGLFRVSEMALNALANDAFLQLRTDGALLIAYAQLLSMQQLSVLGELAAGRAQRAAQVQLGKDLDLSWLDGDVIKFGPGPVV
jgi:hypothetical protein